MKHKNKYTERSIILITEKILQKCNRAGNDKKSNYNRAYCKIIRAKLETKSEYLVKMFVYNMHKFKKVHTNTPYFTTHLTIQIANMIVKNAISMVINIGGKMPILAVINLKKSDEPSKIEDISVKLKLNVPYCSSYFLLFI